VYIGNREFLRHIHGSRVYPKPDQPPDLFGLYL